MTLSPRARGHKGCNSWRPPDRAVIDRDGVDVLIANLRGRGYRTIGPIASNGAIVHSEINSVEDLPAGWHDEQNPGSYRLRHDDGDGELFGWAVGPQSFKQSVFPPTSVVWRGRRDSKGLRVEPVADGTPAEAFFGARPCEVAALSVLGEVLTGGAHADPTFSRRRNAAFVVAVECGKPAATCFCSSMSSGPSASHGFDLSLTELLGKEQRYLVRVGSALGQAVLDEIPHRDPTTEDDDARRRASSSKPKRRSPAPSMPRLLRPCLPATLSTQDGTMSPNDAWRAGTARLSVRRAFVPP